MKIKQIRNATLVVEYAGKKFLIDPFLADKGTYPPFQNTPNQDLKNPLVNLPLSIDEIIEVDAVIVTHLHLDHFDHVAKEVLPKDLKIFAQNEQDADEIRKAGFHNVEILQNGIFFEEIKLSKTKGEHGRGELVKLLGEVCGIVFNHPNEKTLYIAGDTVWYDEIQTAIDEHKPDIIVVNGGDARYLVGGSLIMGKEDIFQVFTAAPHAKIVVSHMEALNHCVLSRDELRLFIEEKGMSSVLVPNDGESYTF